MMPPSYPSSTLASKSMRCESGAGAVKCASQRGAPRAVADGGAAATTCNKGARSWHADHRGLAKPHRGQRWLAVPCIAQARNCMHQLGCAAVLPRQHSCQGVSRGVRPRKVGKLLPIKPERPRIHKPRPKQNIGGHARARFAASGCCSFARRSSHAQHLSIPQPCGRPRGIAHGAAAPDAGHPHRCARARRARLPRPVMFWQLGMGTTTPTIGTVCADLW